MKTLFNCFVFGLVFSIMPANAQSVNPSDYLNKLPKDMELDNSVRSYQMTTDYYDFDLKSHFIDKKRLAGTITFGLEGDSVRWSDVYYAESTDSAAAFPKGIRLDYLQNFTYKSDKGLFKAGFFNKLPEANTLVKNLFWDILGFDYFAYGCWDSLILNHEFRAEEVNSEVNLAGIGTFKNRDIRITWLGITKINNEICAILKYSAMNNPLNVKLENMSLTGRSHYWGEVYVSLEDKQIEYANLTEDVLTDVKLKDFPEDVRGYTVRKIDLVRINK